MRLTARTAPHPVYWALLLLSGITFGASFSLIKVAVSAGQTPLGLVFWYSLLSVLMILATVVARGNWDWLTKPVIQFCLIWSLLGATLPSVLLFLAARELPAGVIALAIALVPIATFGGAILMKRDRADFRRSIGLGLGAMAVILVIAPETSLPERGDALWMVLPLGVVLCYAAEHLYYAAKAPSGVPPEALLLLMFVFTTLTVMPFAIGSSSFFVPGWPPGKVEWALLGVAVVMVADYFLFIFLVAKTGPVFTSQAAYIVTLAGVGWGMLFFSERHSVWIWLALVLVLVGVSLVQPRTNSR